MTTCSASAVQRYKPQCGTAAAMEKTLHRALCVLIFLLFWGIHLEFEELLRGAVNDYCLIHLLLLCQYEAFTQTQHRFYGCVTFISKEVCVCGVSWQSIALTVVYLFTSIINHS